MVRTATVTEVKARLSELLRKVRDGESILILSRGRPVARIEPAFPGEEGPDARLDRLEKRGMVRRGSGVDPENLADAGKEEYGRGSSLLEALLEDREEAR